MVEKQGSGKVVSSCLDSFKGARSECLRAQSLPLSLSAFSSRLSSRVPGSSLLS